ncbi:MAG: GPR endopeptidase [Oscillospiraceae bacterium]
MNIIFRTDLALEAIEQEKTLPKGGVIEKEEIIGNVKFNKIEIISDTASKKIGKPKGNYYTAGIENFVYLCDDLEQEISAFSNCIENLIPKNGSVLVVGLGNKLITPDAIGPLCTEEIFATAHIPKKVAENFGFNQLREVYAIAPGVLGKTGFEAQEVIKSLINEKKISCVIAVDALAAKNINRLGNTIQMSDTGISPGSGVENARKELSEKTLNVPVISIGIPTVVDCYTLCEDLCGVSSKEIDTMVTPRDIDILVKKGAKFIAMSINHALQPQLTIEELSSLTA